MSNMWLTEHANITAAFVPVDMSAAANNGVWVSLKHYRRLAIVLYKAAGNANEDPQIVVQQATDVAGTGAKALKLKRIRIKTSPNALTGVGTYTAANPDAAPNDNRYTAEGGEQQIVIIELSHEDLDVDNGFDCVRATVADVGTTAQLGAMLYILYDAREPKATVASPLVN